MNKVTPLKMIRLYCIDCQGGDERGSIKSVRLCSIVNCPLYPFRMGKNPFLKGRKKIDTRDKKGKITPYYKEKITHRKGMVTISETQDKTVIEITKEEK